MGNRHAWFPWHREDMNFYAANHLLWGCNKYWYCVHPKDTPRVYQFLREKFYQYLTPIEDNVKQCEIAIQHKTFWFDPWCLLGIKIILIYQKNILKKKKKNFLVLIF